MELKKSIEKIWEFVFIKWRNLKFEVIDELVFYLKVPGEFDDLVKFYQEESEELDKKMYEFKKTFYNHNFMIRWLICEFIDAVVNNTNIHYQRLMADDYSIFKKKELINNGIIAIVQELKDNADFKNIKNNIKTDEDDNKINYRVGKRVIFSDLKIPEKVQKVYHGTNILNARAILETDSLFSNDSTPFNKNKIFFSDNTEDAILYASRWNEEEKHIIFEFDLEKYSLYKRKHNIAHRKGNLYFIESEKIPVKENMVKMYLLKNRQLKEIDIEDIYKETKIYDEDKEKKINDHYSIRNDYFSTRNRVRNLKDLLKNNTIKFSKLSGIPVEKIWELSGLDKKRYKELFNADEREFQNIQEHIEYLKEEREIYPVKEKNTVYYHSTSIVRAKNIIKEGFKGNTLKNTKGYNTVFFSPHIEFTKYFGRLDGEHVGNKIYDYYIIFETDLSNEKLYCNNTYPEVFHWGPISPDVIKKIYLVYKTKVIREISKKELLALE